MSWFRDKFLGGDYTPLEHAFASVLIYMVVSLTLVVVGVPRLAADFCGVGAAIAAFFGREHAQAESKLRKEFGDGAVLRAFLFWRWDWPSQMDLYCPVAAVLLIWLLEQWLW